MKTTVLLAAALALAGCGKVTWKTSRPEVPDTVGGGAMADQQRQAAETRCGPEGRVSQRAGTDGTRGSDWDCERRKP